MKESSTSRCCAPSAEASETRAMRSEPLPRAAASTDGMVHIAAGSFWMGTDRDEGFPGDGEGPAHKVRLRPFLLDRTAVSNEEFAAFVSATGHRTDAETIG